jgi:hypoxia up-regulated 1
MKNKKVKGRDVSSDPRAMEKLAQSAEKVKRVLSANKETKAQVEGLYDEIDFKTKVSRDTFYKMTSDLFERVAQPIDDALALANLTRTDIDQLIIFGGGVRIPKIQEILEKTMGVDQLGKSINGDEAACLGASYRAAVLSKAFRVSKFLIKDINLYPIQMNYDKVRWLRAQRLCAYRVLFSPNSP